MRVFWSRLLAGGDVILCANCSGGCRSGGLPATVCRYLNAVQTTSQHLLRYLAAAVVVNKRRRNVMKDLVRVLQQVCIAAPLPQGEEEWEEQRMMVT